jgi:hypothetical protein
MEFGVQLPLNKQRPASLYRSPACECSYAVIIFCMPRFALVPCFSVIIGIIAGHANAQKCGANAQSTISTDRPQITNSASSSLRKPSIRERVSIDW